MNRFIHPLLTGLLLALSMACTALSAQGDPPLRIGVKRDVPLWGEWQGGELKGLEPDLARDLGRQLGRRVELIGLNTAERIEALQSRRVDLLIATLSDTPQRREMLHLVRPHYYQSGVNVLVRRNDRVTRWEDLQRRRACARQGAFYNRQVFIEFGLELVPLYDNHVAQHAVWLGRCDAWLHDDTALIALLRDPRWSAEFEMPLPSRLNTPWSIAMRREQADSDLARQVSQAVVRWHQSGLLIQLEHRWGIPSSVFVQTMHQRWRDPQHSGCTWPITPDTPSPCL